MCGIAGVVGAEPLNSTHHEQVLRMNDTLIHRGPDGSGTFLRPHAILAMRRLSVIDLSTGWQPLYNEDKSLALVANGEIYNFVELRRQLQSRGHRFMSGSDAEVILHLYEEYGEDCVHHLRGMFVFALWDEVRQHLFLARDRMGEKPLYIYEREGLIYFASELKALLRTGAVDFRLNPSAIYQYFHYQYVPEPLTPIKGIRKLPAATRLTVRPRPWSMTESVYWRLEDAPPLEGDPASTIRAELERVSELIVRSDVPVGVALSGGLDSSAIAALAARAYPGQLTAFTVGYERRPRSDERHKAKTIADHLSIPLHEVEIKTQDMVAAFPALAFRTDDPIADIASYGYDALMQAVRNRNIPVMLAGQGGDELFWGYPWMREALHQTIRKQRWQIEGHPELFDYIGFELPPTNSRWGMYDWCRSIGGLRSSYSQFRRDQQNPRNRMIFYDHCPWFRTIRGSIRPILTDTFLDPVYEAELWNPFTVAPPWSRLDILFTKLICETYLLENGIAQGDRLSMASSVELRLPLVDYRLVETVVGLRKVSSDHALPAKAWLKSAVKDLVPDWLLNEPKRGFQPPGAEWIHGVKTRYGRALEDGLLVQFSILKPEVARLMSRSSQRGPLALLAFTALVLEYWCASHLGHIRHLIDGSPLDRSIQCRETILRC